MYSLVIYHNDIKISQHDFSHSELASTYGLGVELICNLFKSIGVDVLSYTLSEIEHSEKYFRINIRLAD